MENRLSEYLTGYRKAHGTQHSLTTMLENCLRQMRIYIAFDTIKQDLLLAKLKAYCFLDKSLALMCSYLKNRRHRTQINNSFSSEKNVTAGVPKGPIDGPLLFDLFINDPVLFRKQCFFSNYADYKFESAKIDLQIYFRAVTSWFFENYMILKSDKCHYVRIEKNYR